MSKIDKSTFDIMEESFGKFIKSLRSRNGITLTQLASQLDLDSANLSKIENGLRAFDEKRLRKLAEAFDLDFEMVKQEYLSDLIAKKVYTTNCSPEVLTLAEEKINYLLNKK